jgi:ankyrin repeat protein
MAVAAPAPFQGPQYIQIPDYTAIQKEFDEAVQMRNFARASELLRIPRRAVDLSGTWCSVISQRHPDGETAKIEVLTFLVQAKATYGEDDDEAQGRIHMHSRDANGKNALHHAAFLGEKDVFKWLLQLRQGHPLLHHSQGGVEFARRDYSGRAPIHYAALNPENGLEMIGAYFEVTGECEPLTQNDETPLLLCCQNGLFTHAEFLLEHTQTLRQQDKTGRSAFAYALIQAMGESSPTQEAFYRWLPRWLQKQLNPNYLISGGDAPLHFIAKHKQINDRTAPFSLSQFCLLMINHHKACCIISADGEGNSPLHIAAKRGDLEFVEDLRSNPKFNNALWMQNHQGQWAWQLAEENGFHQIAALLNPSS